MTISSDSESLPSSGPDPASAPPASPLGLIESALNQFSAITSKHPDSVSGMRGTENGGWSLLVDVVELERIPDSTSVMAIYRVDLDSTGRLLSCERLRRYTRGATDLS